MPEELVSIPEAARRLRVSRVTVYSRIARGTLRAKKVAGRLVVVWTEKKKEA